MKRLICVLLLLGMLLALSGCGKTAAPQGDAQAQHEDFAAAAVDTMKNAKEFSVGYSRADITPNTSVPLAGYGRSSERMSRNVLDNLYATAVAMTDGEGNTVLWIALDLQRANFALVEAMRPVIQEATGIPQDRIMFGGSHTHSGPDVLATTHPAIIAYLQDVLYPQILQAALEALADMKPAEMYYGSAETENLNFVKHYQNTNADGTISFFGDNFGTEVLDDTTKHATDADTTMHLLKFTREGEKDIVVVNWRAHATLTGGLSKYNLSADYVGAFRVALENQANCEFAFFNGAAGNINAKSRIVEEQRAADYLEHGYLLSQYALEGLANMTKLETGTIRTQQETMNMTVDRPDYNTYLSAKSIWAYFSQTGDSTTGKAMGEPYGIRSVYHAEMLVIRYGKPETLPVEINAIAIGDSFAMTTAPNELFDSLISDLEEVSPYENLMYMGYANGNQGYIPSDYGWEYSCYESDCSYFYPGSGEEITATMLKLLNNIKAEV